jgi:hypothetical protein
MDPQVLENYIDILDTKVASYENRVGDSRPSFCFNSSGNPLGTPASTGNLQHFTQAECESLPNSAWYQNGECANTTAGQASYSLRCYSATGASRATTTASATELSNAFQPISQYYSNLVSIRERLNVFLECSTNHLKDNSSGPSLNEERYSNRANPQDTVMPRELVFGLFSQLRPSSVPIVMAAGVFMSCLALLIIFQMFGFTGEIHAPPALIQAYGSIGAAAATPLYQNPMALSGISIVLGVGVIILGVMYYRSKK